MNRKVSGLPAPDWENLSPSAGNDTPTDFDNASGTYLYEFTGNLATSDNGIIIEIGDGTNTNRFFLQRRNSGSTVRAWMTDSIWGTEYLDITRNAYPNATTTNRIVLSWGSFGLYVYLNGAPIFEVDQPMTRNTWDSIFISQGNSPALSSTAVPVKSQHWITSLTREQTAQVSGDVSMVSGISFDSAKNMIVFLGQSNSSGRASGSPSYTNTSRMFMLRNSVSAIAAYADPYDDDTGSLFSELNDSNADVGYAGYLIDELADDGNDYVAVPANKGGTSFEGSDPRWDTQSITSGTRASGLGKVAVSAFMKAKIASQFGPVHSFVWGQGEGDAVAGTAEANYEAQLTKTIEIYKQGIANKEFYLAGMPDNTGDWAGGQSKHDAILSAQTDVAAALSGVTKVSGTDIAGAAGDRVHYDLAGYETVAGLIADSY
jgi:hypothetical protein